MVGRGRIGVLASGSGTILEAILAEGLPVAVVVVDRPCRATEIAQHEGVEAVVAERDSYTNAFDRVAYTERLVDILRAHDVDVVVMAGFGTILAKPIFDAYAGRILNTHPALLPAFPGWHAVEEALAHGVKITGTTVHIATEEVDAGPILAQEAIPVLPGDTVESLHERIKHVERTLYPKTIREFIHSDA
jgi:formyltetrahydrofolate-dependent phosphoribosylglycinamide formyltransferase